MAEEFYGLVNNENILIEYFKIDTENIEILEELKTKYNATNAYKMDLSKEVASIGETYWNGSRFVVPSPYPSWIFNEEENKWEPPFSAPIADGVYKWDEETVSWITIEVDPVEGLPLPPEEN